MEAHVLVADYPAADVLGKYNVGLTHKGCGVS